MNPNEIRALPCGAYQTNAYLVCPDGRGDAFLIDPGDDLSALNAAIAESGRTLSAILLTHGHFDHMLAAAPLQKENGAEVVVLDCMGFTIAIKEKMAELMGVPVILPRTLVARVVGEML